MRSPRDGMKVDIARPEAAGVRRLQHDKVTTLVVSAWLIHEEYSAAAVTVVSSMMLQVKR